MGGAAPGGPPRRLPQQPLAPRLQLLGPPFATNSLGDHDVAFKIHGIVWIDDAQAVEYRISKRYSTSPCVQVSVEQLPLQAA